MAADPYSNGPDDGRDDGRDDGPDDLPDTTNPGADRALSAADSGSHDERQDLAGVLMAEGQTVVYVDDAGRLVRESSKDGVTLLLSESELRATWQGSPSTAGAQRRRRPRDRRAETDDPPGT